MNNERYNQIIDEAYENYCKKSQTKIIDNGDGTMTHISPANHYNFLSKEEFINKCKTDSEFSKNWGVTIYTEVEDDEVWMGIVYNGNATKIKIK